MTSAQMEYLQQHVWVVSGLYGLVRPLEGIRPYRLEMQAKLAVQGHKNLYEFWRPHLAATLAEQGQCIVNLASKEYSKAVLPALPTGTQVITCVFGQWARGKVVERSTLCKQARGAMVRFLAQQQATNPAQMQAFTELGFLYQPQLSTAEQFVFIQEEKPC